MSRTKSGKLKWAILIFCVITVGGVLFLENWPAFGGALKGERLKRAQASPRYHDGTFVNTLPHPSLEFGDVWGYFTEQFFGDQTRVPPTEVPISPIRLGSVQTEPPPGLRVIWLGHSSVYMELDGLRLLIDPVFSHYASPFGGIGPKRFHPPPVDITDLPKVDAVIISHDHYDHLDMRTVQYLSSKGTQFLVPLGVGSHLDEWGVPDRQITELDWWESKEIQGLTLVCTPAQHYSSRGIFDYKETLWASWSIIGPKHRVFYSGDTGFANHFQHIGERLGPFDLSIMKIGQYGPGASWIYSHMNPERAIEAHLAVRAHRMLPVSWGTFNIAFHDWDEPIKLSRQQVKRMWNW
jgi:L-ascorbate metabolism protein UlaG (beta-lactamase superfamily)